MSQTGLLLKAYYEALYQRLEAKKELLAAQTDKLLREEINNRDFGELDEDKYDAYRDACEAFVAERIEMYNPIGIQYTFDRAASRQAFELELQLNWYDSRAEFQALTEAARAKAPLEVTEQSLQQLANELISEMGAFPDSSIISAYEAKPALQKLPDYIVARAIEEIINS